MFLLSVCSLSRCAFEIVVLVAMLEDVVVVDVPAALTGYGYWLVDVDVDLIEEIVGEVLVIDL